MAQELVRLTESRYSEIKMHGEYIDLNSRDLEEPGTKPMFSDRNNFPSAQDLQQAGAEYHVREWLPYLIYYRDVYKPDNDVALEKYRETKEYIEALLTEWLDVIPDDATEKIDSVTMFEWQKMNIKERAAIFEDLIGYYSPVEFDEFVKDLGWKNFMAGYRIQNRREYWKDVSLTDDLLEVWLRVQEGSAEDIRKMAQNGGNACS